MLMRIYFNCSDPPGPVDNSKICQVKNGIPTLLVNSDYAQISSDMWTMLRDTYGGGPEVLIRPAAIPMSSSSAGIRSEDGTEAVTVSVKSEIISEK
jgi:DUSP domain